MIFLTLYLVGHKPDLWDSDKVNDDDKEDQLLFKITEVKDSQNKYCDWDIKEYQPYLEVCKWLF